MPKFKVVKTYSKGLENDKHGRWSRTVYAGNLNPQKFTDFLGLYTIAHIKKLNGYQEGYDKNGKFYFNGKFIVTYQFPNNNSNDLVFDSVEQAIRTIKRKFSKFIKDLTKKVII